jgi:SAM-dependent methyltransferase
MIPVAKKPIAFYKHIVINQLFLDRLDSRIKILDLGCELPLSLFDLQMLYGFNDFVGVDIIASETKIINRYSVFNDPSAKGLYADIKDWHRNYISHLGKERGLSEDRINEIVENYNTCYRILTSFDVTGEEIKKLDKSDCIIITGLLHFLTFNEAKQLVINAVELLNNDGIIIIDANSVENETMTNPEFAKKIGKRSYKSTFNNETVHLFDDLGFNELVRNLNSNGIQKKALEKYVNKKGVGIENYFYCGVKKDSL